MRNFYKLTPEQSTKLRAYQKRKVQDQEFKDSLPKSKMINVLGDENYLSSDHARESDSIRNILEEDDNIYDEINYMESAENIKKDPSRTQFLQEFQDMLDK